MEGILISSASFASHCLREKKKNNNNRSDRELLLLSVRELFFLVTLRSARIASGRKTKKQKNKPRNFLTLKKHHSFKFHSSEFNFCFFFGSSSSSGGSGAEEEEEEEEGEEEEDVKTLDGFCS